MSAILTVHFGNGLSDFHLIQLLDQDLIRRIAYGTVIGLFAAFLGIIYSELVYQHTKRLYIQGKLLRYAPLPENRDWLQGFLIVGMVTCPSTLLYYVYLQPPSISFRFDPVEITFSLFIYALYHDTYFYWAHRYMHVNKRVFYGLHFMHHEYSATMNAFAAGWGETLDDFVEIGAPGMAWTYFVHGNFWHMVLPLYFFLFSALIGHSGFKTHSSFVLYNPFVIPFQSVFGQTMVTPQDHGAHHIYKMANYSLYFRFWDKLNGTYRRNGLKAHPYSYWCALAKEGKLNAIGKVKHRPGATGKQSEELKLVELSQTSWGF